MRYHIIIGRPGVGNSTAQPTTKLQLLKVAALGVLAFLLLSAVIGILLAALAIGSLLAIFLLILLLASSLPRFIATVWRERGRGEGTWKFGAAMIGYTLNSNIRMIENF